MIEDKIGVEMGGAGLQPDGNDNTKDSHCFDVFENVDLLNSYKKYIAHNRMSRPVMLICETINICNYNCIICARRKMTRSEAVMPMDLFEKVLTDYSDMGGGALSLTPMIGEVLMDKFLVERIRLVKKHPKITALSFSTNATLSDIYNDADLGFVVQNADRILISVYGIDPEEHAVLCGKNDYDKAIRNIRRLLDMSDCRGKFLAHLRLLKKRSDEEIESWVRENFGEGLSFGKMRTYSNWAGAIEDDIALPFQGVMVKKSKNDSLCIMPLVACQVYSNGDVSFCPCADYNGDKELHLGNLKESSLKDVYNSQKTKLLWTAEQMGRTPEICLCCTFHWPLSRLTAGHEYLFEDPLRFIGG